MARVFIVEDDEGLRSEMETLIEGDGHAVLTIADFSDVAAAVVDAAPDLVLLDLSLPGVDGQAICRDLRKRCDIPIMVVTSRDNDLDELLAMSRGADDYMAKPFNPQILLVHVSALLRRASRNENASELACAGVTLDRSRGVVSYGGVQSDMTRNELLLLHVLMSHAGDIVSRADLQEALWQSDEFIDDNTLTVNINRLRMTLSSVGVPESFVQTKRGMGYLVER